MKVVIDTNILISGAGDDFSYSKKIIDEVIKGNISAFATHQTMQENKLLLKKAVKDREYKELLEKYFHYLQIVPKPREKIDVVWDKDDNKFFESALSAGAEYLITNDKDVLYVQEFRGIKIVTPEDFWAGYRDDSGGSSAWDDWMRMIMGN